MKREGVRQRDCQSPRERERYGQRKRAHERNGKRAMKICTEGVCIRFRLWNDFQTAGHRSPRHCVTHRGICISLIRAKESQLHYYFRKAVRVIDRLDLGQIAAVPIRGSSSPALCEYLRANISRHLHEVSFCCQWLQSRESLCPHKVKHLGLFFHILRMYLCITVFMHVNPGEMVSPGNIWGKPVKTTPSFIFMHIYRMFSLQKQHGVITLKNHISLIGRMLIRGEDASQGLNDKLTSLNKSRLLLKRSVRRYKREQRTVTCTQHTQLNTFNKWTQRNAT